jgi:hypothetical protein
MEYLNNAFSRQRATRKKGIGTLRGSRRDTGAEVGETRRESVSKTVRRMRVRTGSRGENLLVPPLWQKWSLLGLFQTARALTIKLLSARL